MHLDDESWSDRAADAPGPSVGPSIAFTGEGEDGEGPPGQDLMAFLSDFRCALNGDANPAPATADDPGADALSGPTGVLAGVAWGVSVEETDWRGDPYLGSDVQVDPTWWVAADRRWYPPELHPDRLHEATA